MAEFISLSCSCFFVQVHQKELDLMEKTAQEKLEQEFLLQQVGLNLFRFNFCHMFNAFRPPLAAGTLPH